MSQSILTFLVLSAVFTVIFLVAVLFGLFKNKKMPKWRLKPDEKGTYTLEKWYSGIGMYLAEAVRVTREQANKQIKLTEREVLYYKDPDRDELSVNEIELVRLISHTQQAMHNNSGFEPSVSVFNNYLHQLENCGIDKTPIDVFLPPATVIKRGCTIKCLVKAFERRSDGIEPY